MLKVLRHIFNATRYSLLGIKATWRTSTAFRIECVLFSILAPLAIILGRSGSEQALLLLPLLMVLITELLNSGIESAIDRISKAHHPLSGQAKDMGSAAVGLSLLSVPIVWGLVLIGA